jgi:GT2 family glycosyltransferase
LKLSIIIVNYNVSYFLEQTLRSVKNALRNIEAEVFVVDNNSVDQSVEMVKDKFPEAILIENKVNVGFSKANNQAIKLAKGEYVLLLNPDTVVEEDTFEKCIAFMDKTPDAGGLGVKMVDGKGKFLPESKRGLPTPWVAFSKMTGLSAFFPKSKLFGGYHLTYLDKEKIHEIEILSGAYMLMRKAVLDKVGLLDEDYFMYGEDVDLSYRIIKGGYKNYYFPETRIIHYKGESTKKSSVNYVIVFYKAMKIFADKHFSQNNAGLFSFLINIAIVFRAGIALCYRFANDAALFLADFSSVFVGMFLIKNYWESNHKYVGIYPDYYLFLVIPIYIIIWQTGIYLNGGYNRPFKFVPIFRGIFIGTLLIAAFSNFYDPIRFSKAIILLGAGWSVLAVMLVRYSIQLAKYGNFNLEGFKEKRLLIVGNPEETKRALKLIKDSDIKIQLVGFLSPFENKINEQHYIGTIGQLTDVVQVFEVEEVIFCSKDISVQEIITLMTHSSINNVEYKIFPDKSNFIIGSNSKNSQGDFYTINVELGIINKNNKRAKRMLDIVLSLIFLMTSPLLMWFTNKPSEFVKNCLNVFLGSYSWVGFANAEQMNLPDIKKGVLNPAIRFSYANLDSENVKRLDLLYAKDYKPETDLIIILKGFPYLGMSVN